MFPWTSEPQIHKDISVLRCRGDAAVCIGMEEGSVVGRAERCKGAGASTLVAKRVNEFSFWSVGGRFLQGIQYGMELSD